MFRRFERETFITVLRNIPPREAVWIPLRYRGIASFLKLQREQSAITTQSATRTRSESEAREIQIPSPHKSEKEKLSHPLWDN